MGGIFISYRREDSQGEALHLFDDVKESFGADQVFMDVTGIDPGKDFRKVIEGAVGACDVLIAVIGKEWIDEVDESGRRRIDDPKDFVRLEIAAALRRDIAVIPVLVQGAVMPRSDQLPAELEALAWRNAFELRHNRWAADVADLLKALTKALPAAVTPTTLPSTEKPSGAQRGFPPSLGKSSIAVFAVLLILAITIAIFSFSQNDAQQFISIKPQLISPEDGSRFFHFPRHNEFNWEKVPGATSYRMEVEAESGGQWYPFEKRTVNANHASLEFLGAQPGRWRVTAINQAGEESKNSDWWVFYYEQ